GGTNAHVLVEAAPAADATARVPLEPPRFRRVDLADADARKSTPAATDRTEAVADVVEGAWE
ncbi:hypothetical protein, partial [Luteibacter sp. CQ10]|uniref:hypothetical protein n=1 Tax=Luteibacter sp. CQ10 TaxID=2805821 RepID=UPI0034A0F444